MKKSRKFITSALVIAIALLLNLFAHTYAGASNFKNSGTAEAIAKKSYWHSLYTCYSLKNGGDKSYYKKSNRRYNANGTDFKNDSSSGWGQIDSEIEAGKDYSDTWGFSYRKLFPNHNAKNSVYLPNGLTPAGDDSSNCAHVINGDAWDGGDGFKDTRLSVLNGPSAGRKSVTAKILARLRRTATAIRIVFVSRSLTGKQAT